MDRETDCARRSYDPRCTPDGMDGLYVDCTFGRGGHSRHILQQLSSKGRLMAFDVDRAVLLPRSRLTGPGGCGFWQEVGARGAEQASQGFHGQDARFMIVHRPFGELREELNGRKIVTWSEALSLSL